MADLKAIRDFFTEEEWQIIDYAISEYQDHLFDDDGEQEIYDSIQDKLNQLFHEVQSWNPESLNFKSSCVMNVGKVLTCLLLSSMIMCPLWVLINSLN